MRAPVSIVDGNHMVFNFLLPDKSCKPFWCTYMDMKMKKFAPSFSLKLILQTKVLYVIYLFELPHDSLCTTTILGVHNRNINSWTVIFCSWYLTCRKYATHYMWSKIKHIHSGRHLKSQCKKSFNMSKDIVELNLSSSYVCEEVWLVGIGRKRSILFFN